VRQKGKPAIAEDLGWFSIGLGLSLLGRALRAPDSARLSRLRKAEQAGALEAKAAVTILRSPEEVYGFWRDFRNLPRFMRDPESAEIVEERPNELLAWRSLEGADVSHSGAVRFTPAPGGRGTEVRVELDYEPGRQLDDDLRALKQVLEAGEVVRSDASPGGGRSKQRPAQPAEDGRS
jgi:uncharacterized membrane protein